jgi:bacterioferritin-associated ferredoxin
MQGLQRQSALDPGLGLRMQAVIDAVKNGADTVEKVAEKTGAGIDCGRCKALVANIIELGR